MKKIFKMKIEEDLDNLGLAVGDEFTTNGEQADWVPEDFGEDKLGEGWEKDGYKVVGKD